MSIGTTVKAIQDIMRKDAGVDGDAQRLNQLGWMLFFKIFSDGEEELELFQDDYRSPIPERLRWKNWAADPEGITGEALLDFVNNDLFKTLKNLSLDADATGRGAVARGVFEDAINYMKSGHLMRQVINRINEIDFNNSKDRHLFGDIYEQILRDLQSAGNAGEFYTPRAVTQFMVEMVDPRLGEHVLDPACGTGGFLTGALEHMRKQERTKEDREKWQKSIVGVEKKALPHLLCVTNMMLHGVEVPTNVQHRNMLARSLASYTSQDRVDVILTNPPFGGMEEDGVEKGFGAYRTKETADLFLVLIMHLLRDGGRAAIVLPDGTLFGEGVKTRIKEKLLTECDLHTVVRLPHGVFSPYTGIKTNLLFFTKGQPTREVWYYEHPYPSGYKSYSKMKPIRLEEFQPERDWWHARQETPQAWRVSVDEIRAANFNLDFKNSHQNSEEKIDLEALVAHHVEVMDAVSQARERLKRELTRGDERHRIKPQTIFDHFERLVTAPQAVAYLRELILQLTVQGELTKQDPRDEPATSLLRRIRAEKERLFKEKQLKNAAPLPPVDPGEAPFLLPSGWAWARLGDLAKVSEYGTSQKASEVKDEVPVLRMNNISGGKIIYENLKYLPASISDLPRLYLQRDDLLFNRTNSYELVGKTGIYKGENNKMTFASYLIRLSLFTDLLDADFVNLVMNSAYFRKHQIEPNITQQNGQANFNGTKLSLTFIPLPPLEEQRRIVATVNRLMKLCDELEKNLHQYEADRERLLRAAVRAALVPTHEESALESTAVVVK